MSVDAESAEAKGMILTSRAICRMLSKCTILIGGIYGEKQRIWKKLTGVLILNQALVTGTRIRLGRLKGVDVSRPLQPALHKCYSGICLPIDPDWRTLPNRKVIILVSLPMLRHCYISEVAPSGLHLPQFTYTEPKVAPNAGAKGNDRPAQYEESLSQGFPFSAFFQPSSSASPPFSIIQPSSGPVSVNASNRFCTRLYPRPPSILLVPRRHLLDFCGVL